MKNQRQFNNLLDISGIYFSQAAIEFDCALRNPGKEAHGFEAAKRLGEIIQSLAADQNPIDRVFISEVVATLQCATDMDTVGTALITAAPDNWVELRDFCVRLGNNLLRHRQSRDMPQHRFLIAA